MPNLHLYLHQPQPVFRARVNLFAPTYPMEYLQFDGVTLGAYGDVEDGMFFMVGSTEDGDDKGRGRVKNQPTSTAINIGRVSQGAHDGELDVADNDYITVWWDYRIHSKIPYINDAGTMFKDGGTGVGDNTTNMPPVANTGPGFAATIDAGTGRVTVAFDGGISFAVAEGATITTFLWNIEDGIATFGTINDAQITVTFPAGFRWITLTVTDSNGRTHSARCPVFARDPDNDATVQHFEIEAHRVSIDRGQQLNIRILEDAPRSTYPDGCLVMFWEDEPLSPYDRNHMQFVGWHQSDQVSARATRTGNLRDTVLECVDALGRLDTLPGFAQVIKRANTPDKWTDMYLPTMDKFIHYVLHWHSTALEVVDYFPSDIGDSYPFVIFTSQGESLYSQVNNQARTLVPDHRFTCNRRGQLAIVADPMLQDVADRTIIVQGTFTEQYTQDLRFTYMRPPRTHWMRGNALRTATDYTDVDGVDTLFTAHSIAPGTAPGQGVSAVETNEQLTRSQEDLNAVTGHRYARANSPYGLVTVTPSDGANYTHVDPATMDWVNLYVGAETAAQRGLTFANVRTQCKEIDIRYDDPGTGLVRTLIFQVEIETVGLPAETVLPTGAPVDNPPVLTLLGDNPMLVSDGVYTEPGATAIDYEDGDITANIVTTGTVDPAVGGTYFVTYTITDAAGNRVSATRTVNVAWVVPDYGDPVVYGGNIAGYVLWSGNAVLRTWDLQAASPVWARVDTGITGTILDGQYVHVDANTVGMWLMTADAIWWCGNIMATVPSWSAVLPIATVRAADALVSGANATGVVNFKSMFNYATEPGYLIVATGPTLAGNFEYVHSYTWHTHDYGATWTQVDMNSFTNINSGYTHGYFGCPLYATNIYRSAPGTIWMVRSTPRIGLNAKSAIFKSVDLGHTWTKEYSLTLAVVDPGDAGMLNPYPGITDPSYAAIGANPTATYPALYRSTDGWVTATLLAKPTGYNGMAFDRRPNKRTFDNTHVIAWWRESATGNYHLLESYNQGVTWNLLLNGGAAGAFLTTPNGWPPDVNQWVVVKTASSLDATTIRLTLNNFATLLDKKGNLASVLPGGTWAAGKNNGYALPKVGVNA